MVQVGSRYFSSLNGRSYVRKYSVNCRSCTGQAIFNRLLPMDATKPEQTIVTESNSSTYRDTRDCHDSTITHSLVNKHPRNMLAFNTEIIYKKGVSRNNHYILSSRLALTLILAKE